VRGQFVEIAKGAEVITLLQNEAGGRIAAQGLATSGRALIVWTQSEQAARACFVGQGQAALPLPGSVTRVVDASGAEWRRGADWDSEDGTLRLMRAAADSGCVNLLPGGRSAGMNIIRAMYHRIHSRFRPRFMNRNPRYARYLVGDWTYGWPRVVAYGAGATLEIGRFTSIADGVMILLVGEHRTDWVTTFPFSQYLEAASEFRGHPATKGNVVIGNDVWIGTETLILSGVTIGDGAVIGARSVVTKDVAPYAIVAGNPARHIRFRFSPEAIRDLETICWWDWPLPRIQDAWPLLLAPDVEAFIARYRDGGRHAGTGAALS
jgi:acetyltransferase-like isoleucine patch superfamily enzyme